MKKTSASNDSKQPATRSDIKNLQSEVKSDFNALRVESKTDIKALQTEFKTDLETNMKELAQIMTDGIAFLSNGQDQLQEKVDGVEKRLGTVEVQVSDTNRRLRDLEFDTPTRKDFQKLKQRVDRYIPTSA